MNWGTQDPCCGITETITLHWPSSPGSHCHGDLSSHSSQRQFCWDSWRILSPSHATREISVTVLTDDAGCIQMMTLKTLNSRWNDHVEGGRKIFCKKCFFFETWGLRKLVTFSFCPHCNHASEVLKNNLSWAPSLEMNWLGKRVEAWN